MPDSSMPRRGSREDRTVHGRTADGGEIVRYDRAGKWYVEHATNRWGVSVTKAALLASLPGAQAFLGRPGGGMFDRMVRGDA